MSTENKGQLDQVIDDDFILDEIADLPGFITPPTGAYLCLLPKGIEEKSLKNKSGEEDKYYDAPLTIKEIVELNQGNLEEGEEPPKAGDMFNILFKRDNEYGMGNFKLFAKSIAEKFGCRTVGQIRENSKGLEMLLILKRRNGKDKNGNDIKNINLVKAVVV
jgi:hypothetical protein